MEGNALEVALALLRIPSMRVPLRQRPLPEGIDQLIVLATGAVEPLALAAARSGEPQGQVLEAARFYVREVLLFPGADAYRVLGVSASASDAQIKLHYRHLQHWLHPDRRGNDWESVFATRINRAWNELRTPERRAAHDARTQQATSLEAAGARHRVLVSGWRAAPAANAIHWRGWVLLVGVVGCCLWLALLVLRESHAPAPEWRQASTRAPTEPGRMSPTVGDEPTLQQVGAMPEVAVEPADPASMATAERMTATAAPSPPLPAAPITGSRPTPADSAAMQDSASTVAGVKTLAPLPEKALVSPPRAGTTAAWPAAVPVAAQVSRLSLQQLQLARLRGEELTHYLAGQADRAPPIWRNAAAQDAADSIRGQLDPIREGLRFGQPDWRIAAERASMTSTIQRSGQAGLPAMLRVELAWHEGMWLVDRVEAEELP